MGGVGALGAFKDSKALKVPKTFKVGGYLSSSGWAK